MADLKPLPKFTKITWAKYKALTTPDASTLYWISDSAQHQIYLGSAPYTTAFIVLGSDESLPAAGSAITNAIYYRSSDSTAHYFDGTNFLALSVAKDTTIASDLASDNGKVPTTYAVKQYVDSKATDLGGDKVDKFAGTANHIVTVSATGTKVNVKDSGLVAGGASLAGTPTSTTLATEKAVADHVSTAVSNGTADKLDKFNGTANHIVVVSNTNAKASVKDSGIVVGGATLAATPNSTTVATEKAVAAAIATAESNASTYASGLVAGLGTVFNYKGTKADMTALNAVTGMKAGDVWNVTTGANGTSAEYVYNGTAWEELGTTIDLSGYATKVATTANGQLLKADANGNIAATGLTAGGATLAASPKSTVLATEAAVKAYADSVANAAAGAYLPFVSGGSNSHIPLIATNGSTLSDSGKVIGGATLAATPDANTLATEAGVAAAISAQAGSDAAAYLPKINGTANRIVTVESTATAANVKDSGKSIGGATLAATPNSNTVATEVAVKTYADSKYTKIASAASHTDKVMFFGTNGATVADKGVGIDTTSFAATPSSTTLATEAAVADYVTTALQEIAWNEIS